MGLRNEHEGNSNLRNLANHDKFTNAGGLEAYIRHCEGEEDAPIRAALVALQNAEGEYPKNMTPEILQLIVNHVAQHSNGAHHDARVKEAVALTSGKIGVPVPEPTVPVANANVQPAAPVVEANVQPAAPVVEANVQPAVPVVEANVQQPAAPVVDANVQPAAPVVEANAPAAAPVVDANAQPADPVVDANVQPAAPVVDANAPAADPVADANAQQRAPVVDVPSPSVLYGFNAKDEDECLDVVYNSQNSNAILAATSASPAACAVRLDKMRNR